MRKVRTCLWFESEGEAAATFYTSLLPNSRIEGVFRPSPSAPALVVEFSLDGQSYQALNGGPGHPQTDAASIVVMAQDQAETDRLWAALTGEGGAPVQCGWLRDRWGVCWQIVPARAIELLSQSDRAASGRVMAALMEMVKIDVAALEKAAAG